VHKAEEKDRLVNSQGGKTEKESPLSRSRRNTPDGKNQKTGTEQVKRKEIERVDDFYRRGGGPVSRLLCENGNPRPLHG